MNVIDRVTARLAGQPVAAVEVRPLQAALVVRGLGLLRAALREFVTEQKVEGNGKAVDQIEEELLVIERLIVTYGVLR